MSAADDRGVYNARMLDLIALLREHETIGPACTFAGLDEETVWNVAERAADIYKVDSETSLALILIGSILT